MSLLGFKMKLSDLVEKENERCDFERAITFLRIVIKEVLHFALSMILKTKDIHG